jgi:hypothetical protein
MHILSPRLRGDFLSFRFFLRYFGGESERMKQEKRFKGFINSLTDSVRSHREFKNDLLWVSNVKSRIYF